MATSTVMKMNGPVTGAVMIAVTNAVMNAAMQNMEKPLKRMKWKIIPEA